MHRGGFFKIFLVIAAITLLLDWYVFSGLRTFTADWQSQRMRHIVLWLYLVLSVGVTFLLLFGFGSFSTAKGMTPFHEWVLSLFLTFFVTKIFFCVVLFLGDTGRFLYGAGDNIIHKDSGPLFPARRKFISEIA
ncbi:MAG: hypothetical protein ABI203_05635, partial [Mucilaginibacter sp.]